MSDGKPHIAVRRLTEADSIPELTALLHRAYRRLGEMGLRFVATWQDESITRKRVGEGACFVAEAGGRIVGTIVFQGAAETGGCPWYDRPEVGCLHQFAVEPEWQGRGVGRRLLEVVEAAARASGAAELALDTAEDAHHLIALYEHWGFRRVGFARWKAVNYRSVVMSKALEEGG